MSKRKRDAAGNGDSAEGPTEARAGVAAGNTALQSEPGTATDALMSDPSAAAGTPTPHPGPAAQAATPFLTANGAQGTGGTDAATHAPAQPSGSNAEHAAEQEPNAKRPRAEPTLPCSQQQQPQPDELQRAASVSAVSQQDPQPLEQQSSHVEPSSAENGSGSSPGSKAVSAAADHGVAPERSGSVAQPGGGGGGGGGDGATGGAAAAAGAGTAGKSGCGAAATLPADLDLKATAEDLRQQENDLESALEVRSTMGIVQHAFCACFLSVCLHCALAGGCRLLRGTTTA